MSRSQRIKTAQEAADEAANKLYAEFIAIGMDPDRANGFADTLRERILRNWDKRHLDLTITDNTPKNTAKPASPHKTPEEKKSVPLETCEPEMGADFVLVEDPNVTEINVTDIDAYATRFFKYVEDESKEPDESDEVTKQAAENGAWIIVDDLK